MTQICIKRQILFNEHQWSVSFPGDSVTIFAQDIQLLNKQKIIVTASYLSVEFLLSLWL